MATTTVTDKGALLIPPELRERYGLRSGMRVHIIEYGDILTIVPSTPDSISLSCGMLRAGSSLVNALQEFREAGTKSHNHSETGESASNRKNARAKGSKGSDSE